ncbi:omega-3 polyunsaturated fatty acid synthase subunit, PfaB [Richelia intracellularis]|nr:omega-3 polyunsaturated fatty acid synthase subunit, PfaB [Richelia intracellularis]
MYADGARIFIETGAGNVCSRWIDKNLSARPHLTVSLNRRGLDDHAGLVKALAKLISHQVDVDLSPLIAPELPTNKKAKFTQKKVILGGDSFIDKIVTEENKKLFHNIANKVISSPQTKPNIPQVETKNKIYIQDILNLTKTPPATPQVLKTTTKYQPQPEKPPMLTTATSNIQPTDKQLHKNTSIFHQTHNTFLQSRQEFSLQMSQMIQLQIACAEKLVEELKSQK